MRLLLDSRELLPSASPSWTPHLTPVSALKDDNISPDAKKADGKEARCYGNRTTRQRENHKQTIQTQKLMTMLSIAIVTATIDMTISRLCLLFLL